MDEDRRRAPRFPTGEAVTGRYPATPFAGKLDNLSRTGCKLTIDGTHLPLGSTVLIDFSERKTISGQVAWASGSSVGVRFHRSLQEEEVAKIAAQTEPGATGEWTLAK